MKKTFWIALSIIIGVLILIGIFILFGSKGSEKVCTLEYSPVCGIDGKTYSNPCFAGNVEIAYNGECQTDEIVDGLICTLEYSPVCGIDGKTYSNPCFAGNVEIAYNGECGF